MTERVDCCITLSRQFSASAAEVYEAWITPHIMRHWLAPGPNVVVHIETEPRIGGALLIRSQAPDGALHTINGVYRDLVPGRRIVMTWTYTGPFALISGMETLIEISLHRDSDTRTTMTFTQSQFASREAGAAYEGDWPSCFEKLTTVLALPVQPKRK
ncbi:hypothetical protein W911_05010 [Hyphomicrobium nitrativorans NL23]|jgi:uncharacterized protein YndB with AHSA1/START domain|uniref:Activator of Hsp90 ATPase homologue 1/2-like C-terminal domain-containing protein n=1 Tax=Hyphomicrobium nitrativorans NL23 TaxID=1029756 RepID=V5SGJ3_9HYPH|nr:MULTISPECIES: SRPBCC domain-containing protein [Hyphomicrobium]AHB49986.1 hypothetical protein W911_05010 [Hyphomicrobium nitrativorans NL23]HRN88990.1 SRPBCC domain-containing protein [Hyphomicrobium sp.]HRQ27506.1 SRPBCC domain-containing protein [Hyphomicrobium sp.]